QEQAAQEDQRQGNGIADAGEIAVAVDADQVDQRGHEVGAGGDAAQEEVGDDPPAPFGVRDEVVHASPSSGAAAGVGGGWTGGEGVALASASPLRRSRKANSAPSAVVIAANTAQKLEGSTLRLGSFGLEGRP